MKRQFRGEGGAKAKAVEAISNVKAKIDAAPKDLRAIYDELAGRLRSLVPLHSDYDSLGSDIVELQPGQHPARFARRKGLIQGAG